MLFVQRRRPRRKSPAPSAPAPGPWAWCPRRGPQGLRGRRGKHTQKRKGNQKAGGIWGLLEPKKCLRPRYWRRLVPASLMKFGVPKKGPPFRAMPSTFMVIPASVKEIHNHAGPFVRSPKKQSDSDGTNRLAYKHTLPVRVPFPRTPTRPVPRRRFGVRDGVGSGGRTPRGPVGLAVRATESPSSFQERLRKHRACGGTYAMGQKKKGLSSTSLGSCS